MCQIDISKSGTYPESRAMLINGKTVQKFGLRVKGSSFPNEIVCFYPKTRAECMLGGKITTCFLHNSL